MMTKQHWTAYWESGVLTSLPNDFKENYDGELAEFWRSIVKQTAADSQVLDLCTGNGAVAILLMEQAAEEHIPISMTAVDASDIHPEVLINQFPDKKAILNDIRFMGNCLVEDMSETIRQTFDLIVSQYGLEYCDTEPAAQAIAASLNPGGRLAFVSHAADTAILSYMREEEQIYQLFDHANGWEMLQKFARNQLSVNGFKNKLNQFLTHIKAYTHLRSMPLYNNWGQAMVHLLSMPNNALKEQRKSVFKFLQQYQYSRARAQDMLQVSDKLTAHPEWYKTFEQHGLELQQQGVIHHQGEHIAGHSYQFVKTR
jgi:SAM-dependent methyltransferase